MISYYLLSLSVLVSIIHTSCCMYANLQCKYLTLKSISTRYFRAEKDISYSDSPSRYLITFTMDGPQSNGSSSSLTPRPSISLHNIATNIPGATPAPAQPTHQRFRAITHLAVVSAFILPITLLPYIFTRRQLSLVRQQVGEMRTRMRALQQDLNIAVSEITTCKDEHRRLRALIHDMMQETDELRFRAEAKEVEQSKSDNIMKGDLKRLLDDVYHSRYMSCPQG